MTRGYLERRSGNMGQQFECLNAGSQLWMSQGPECWPRFESFSITSHQSAVALADSVSVLHQYFYHFPNTPIDVFL